MYPVVILLVTFSLWVVGIPTPGKYPVYTLRIYMLTSYMYYVEHAG